MRVLLTTPPWTRIVPFYVCRAEHNLRLRDIHDKDDLLQLAMSAEYQLGIEWPHAGLRIIKANVPSLDVLEYPDPEEYEDQLRSRSYDAVAFSFYRKDIPEILPMVQTARRYGVREVWAGNYGANSPGMEKVFDRIFMGDGAAPLKQLVEGRTLQYRRHPILTGTIMRRTPVGYLYTAVGCKFRCKFCSTRNFIPKPLYTSIEEIRRVLDEYVRAGIQQVTIFDETFLQSRKRSEQVMHELHKRGLTWNCTTRVDLLQGRVSHLHDMGMRFVYTGIESLTNATLTDAGKGHTSSAVLKLFGELHELGVTTTITYILGFERDTIESVIESMKLIKTEIKPFCTSLLVLTPHVNAKMDHLESLIVDHDPRHYDTRHLVWEHPYLSREDIRELLWIGHRETVHPRNVISKRIIGRLERLEASNPPLYSRRAYEAYRRGDGSAGGRAQDRAAAMHG